MQSVASSRGRGLLCGKKVFCMPLYVGCKLFMYMLDGLSAKLTQETRDVVTAATDVLQMCPLVPDFDKQGS